MVMLLLTGEWMMVILERSLGVENWHVEGGRKDRTPKVVRKLVKVSWRNCLCDQL